MENEYDLILQIISGKSDLFEQIVLKYQNLIYTVCFNIVKNAPDAEDMAQETFMSAYYSLSGFRGGENPRGGELKSWLCRIAANKSIDFKRKQAKLLTTSEFEMNVTDSLDSVYILLEKKETKERLDNILSVIPEKYSSVVREFYYNQLPVKEIARLMAVPEKTIETQLYRAKKLIRERWGENDT